MLFYLIDSFVLVRIDNYNFQYFQIIYLLMTFFNYFSPDPFGPQAGLFLISTTKHMCHYTTENRWGFVVRSKSDIFQDTTT